MKWKRNDKVIEEPIVDYLEKLFEEELAKGRTLKVSVGTDSQKSGKLYKFATVILITTSEDLGGGVIVGRGGCGNVGIAGIIDAIVICGIPTRIVRLSSNANAGRSILAGRVVRGNSRHVYNSTAVGLNCGFVINGHGFVYG